MLLVVIIAALIWGVGSITRTPRVLRAWATGFLWAAVVLAHLILPDGNEIRVATGGSAAPWLLLGGVVLMVLGYRTVLRRLRARARPSAAEGESAGPFREAELRRYARHIILREVGGPGQVALKRSKVLVVGAGVVWDPITCWLTSYGACMLSAAITYEVFLRAGGQGLRQMDKPWVKRILDGIHARPVRGVALLRAIFMIAPPVTVALALAGLRRRDHMLGTAIGVLIPLTGIVWLLQLGWELPFG